MVETEDAVEFEHKGFKCTITQRPDLCYVYQVCGFRQADNVVWIPRIKFDKDLTMSQIKVAAIEMIEGTFEGVIEEYGNLFVWTGERK